MTAYRIIYYEGAPRVVMARDMAEALRMARLLSSSVIRVVTRV